MDFLKNKMVLVGIGVAVVLIAIAGYVILSPKSAQPQDQQADQQDMTVQKLSPSDIGLTFTASSDKRKVKFAISDVKGMKHLDYELTYDADQTSSPDEEDAGQVGGKTQKGVIGEADIKPEDSKYETKDLDLGTCSSGTCRYDTGVTSVHLDLKITKTDGKIYQVEDDLSL